MQKHLDLIGVLNIALGLFGLLACGIVLVVMTLGGLATADPAAMMVTSGVASFVTVLILLFAVPSLAVGVALLMRKPWAPTGAFIVGALNLANPPFGTLLGIYTLWVMVRVPEMEYRTA
jgi:hypothetical protein